MLAMIQNLQRIYDHCWVGYSRMTETEAEWLLRAIHYLERHAESENEVR
jgi:hypothetical protein